MRKRETIVRCDLDGEKTNHPDYYNTGKIEVIDFIEDQNLGFDLGNVVKYICRAGRKNPKTEITDLEKALWYLERHIEEKKKVIRYVEITTDPKELFDGSHFDMFTGAKAKSKVMPQ